MNFDKSNRTPLKAGTAVKIPSLNREYIIDAEAGSGGLCLMYIAHEKNSPHRFVALKELFPKSVEAASVSRRADGKIVIYNPILESEDDDNPGAWEEILRCFKREVELSRRAAALYDSDGNLLLQNNPDVLAVEGPFSDEKGNSYIAIDTRNGKSLQQFIDNGWESKADRGVCRNNLLGEIFDILLKTTRRLAFMHGDHQMYHLDLSPANIYVSPVDGGTGVEPAIIDYGSAYDYGDDGDIRAHRFTCNPFSAPELSALSALNDSESGYRPDVTTDTYSLVAILFYAVLGELYTVDKLYEGAWKAKLRALYPETVYGDFAKELIDFFKKGLSPEQRDRFVTVRSPAGKEQASLYRALEALKAGYKETDILDAVPMDELMSYLLLDRHPLYDYLSADGNIHVLCLGSGEFVTRMILTMLGTGQMIGRRLFIHVVSGNAEEYKGILLEKAPLLEKYADFGDGAVAESHVSFTVETVRDLTDEESCRAVAEKYGALCRYVVISLGANNINVNLARRYAAAIGEPSGKTLINYYMAEDDANNVRADVDGSVIPKGVTALPFGNMLASFNKEVHALGEKAFKVHYLYTKLSDPNASKEDCLRGFMGKSYEQRSSTAAAVHINYKLASLGISTKGPKQSHRSADSCEQRIIEAYTKKIAKADIKGKLLQLEHSRWMFFMIADGYRLPTEDDIERYCFRQVGKDFNAAFKCTAEDVKFHPCLVPCSDAGLCLPQDHGEWDKYDSFEKIDAAEYDELDRVALRFHLIAKERTERKSTAQIIISLVKGVLADRLNLAHGAVSVTTAYERFESYIEGVLSHKSTVELEERLAVVKEKFRNAGVDVSDVEEQLREQLAVFKEYNSYKDYKKSDATIIDNLLWIKFSGYTVMFKQLAPSALSDIAVPLVAEPERLVYFGAEKPSLTEFFEAHGDNTKISFDSTEYTDVEGIYGRLAHHVASVAADRYIVDVTEATPIFVIAAVRLAEANKKVGVVCYNSAKGGVDNIMNATFALMYKLNNRLSSEEVFELYGAKEKPGADSYMLKLDGHINALWAFYEKHAEQWEELSAFFKILACGSSEMHISDMLIPESCRFATYKRRIAAEVFEDTGMEEILQKLYEHGVIKKPEIVNAEAYISFSFDYPVIKNDKGDDLLGSRFNYLFSDLGNIKLKCRISVNPNGAVSIDIVSGINVRIIHDNRFEDRETKKVFKLENVVDALYELEDIQAISGLSVTRKGDMFTVVFTYNNSAVKSCLTTAGNILEAYVWYKAKQTGFFDSVQANFSFTWSNPKVSNELDVIMTHKLTTLVCSCKTAKMNKEHLYEIAAIASRFSANTKPVIIYSSEKSVENGKISNSTEQVRQRAEEMGIYLIDRDTLDDNLGEALIRIAGDIGC